MQKTINFMSYLLCFLMIFYLLICLLPISGCSKSYKYDYSVKDFFYEISKKQNFTLTYKENLGETYSSTTKIKCTKNRVEYEENDDLKFIIDYQGNKTYCYDYNYKSGKWEKDELNEDYGIKDILSMFSVVSAMSSALKYDNIEKCYKGESEGSKIVVRFQGKSVYLSCITGNYKVEYLFEQIGGTKINLPKTKDIE